MVYKKGHCHLQGYTPPPPLLAPSNVHDDVYDNVISGNESSLEMLISRSLEIKIIWTFDRLSNFFFNKSCTHITFKYAVKHRYMDNGYMCLDVILFTSFL